MTTTGIQAKVAKSMAISVKELPFLLLLLVPMTFGETDIFLEVTDFSPSEVELSCHLEYDGNLTGVYFEALKGKQTCLFRNMDGCQSYYKDECGNIHCIEDVKTHPDTLTLSMPLSGECEEVHDVRCVIGGTNSLSDLEKSIKVTAQSEPPMISINNDQNLEVSCDPVEIACTIKNMCYKTKLDIFGDVRMEDVDTSHTKEGSRFIATAKTTAIFETARNYTIGCKESGKGVSYSRSSTFEVYPSKKATCLKDAKETEEAPAPWKSSSIAVSVILGIVLIACAACLVWFVVKKVTANNRRNRYVTLRPRVIGKRTIPKILTPEDCVCGIWIKEDLKNGTEIAKYIKNYGGKVEEADMQNIQEAQNYTSYFAVISSKSLENNQYIAYLRSVLWRMYSADYISTVVLVMIGEEITDNQLEECLMTNLQAFPRVKALDELTADHLQEIAKKLQESNGHQFNTEVSHAIENLGFVLAWYYFHEYLVFILPGMMERIKQSKFSKELSEKINRRFIIIIPESCRTPARLNEIDEKFYSNERLDDGIEIRRPHCPAFHSNVTVHQIKKSDDEVCLFCGEYALSILALEEMGRSGKLQQGEIKKQLRQFTETLKSILESHPSCRGKAVVFTFKEDTTLAEELFNRIKNSDQQGPSDLVKPVTKVAEGLVQSYFHLHLKTIGPSIAERITPIKYYHRRKMATKLFILLPHSSYSFQNLKTVDKLEMETVIGGNRRRYDTTVCQVSDGRETYYACVDYCTPVMVMYEMEKKENQAGLSSAQIAAEVRVFYEILYNMLHVPSAPDYCQKFELVYFNGDNAKTSGKKLSEMLVGKIKESLKEEFYDDLEEITNDRQSIGCCV